MAVRGMHRGIPGLKRGGKVHRTGIYRLHAGEEVKPAKRKRSRKRGSK
jgi:hypothetical protein